jgi:hypothetical protein
MNLVFGALLIVGIGVLVVLLAVVAIAAISRSPGKHGTSGSLSSAAGNPVAARAGEEARRRNDARRGGVGG